MIGSGLCNEMTTVFTFTSCSLIQFAFCFLFFHVRIKGRISALFMNLDNTDLPSSLYMKLKKIITVSSM